MAVFWEDADLFCGRIVAVRAVDLVVVDLEDCAGLSEVCVLVGVCGVWVTRFLGVENVGCVGQGVGVVCLGFNGGVVRFILDRRVVCVAV